MKFNKKTIQKIGLGALVMGAMLLIGNVAMASETGVWTTLNVSGDLSKSLTLNVEEQFRFSDVTGADLARQHTDIGITNQVNDVLNIGVGYRNVSTGEQRLSVSLGLRLLTGTINLDSLSKLELRDGDTLRGRTSVTAAASVSNVTPFVSDEVFVDDSGVTGNRLTIGLSRAVTSVVGINAFYLLDTTLGNATSNTHVMGVGLSVSL